MTADKPTGLSPSENLARKINLLMDTAEAEGRKIAFNDVRDAMNAAGTKISRGRWHYMRAGTGPVVKNVELLQNLAKFFGVNEGYLLDSDEALPARVEAQLDLLTTMRAKKVRNFAARQLDGLSPETLLQIRDLIDKQLAASPQVPATSGTD
ncbi:transcriptional regulator with XRE-family HTH domain [Arthrobacter sp. UYCo732]